jgi:hypothetical protein
MVERRTCARWILLCWVLQQGEKIKIERFGAMRYNLRINRLGWRTRGALAIEGRPVLTEFMLGLAIFEQEFGQSP